MTSIPKLYIASKEVLFGAALGEEHLYLYLDPDTDGDHNAGTGTDMQIIRGGVASNYEESGLGSSILIEVGSDSDVSADAFVLIDTPESRNFRELFSGAAATSTWTTLQSLAMTYRVADTTLSDVYQTDYTYAALGTNSNSFVATLINRLGLNLAAVAPYADGSTSVVQTIGWFPYHSHILDSGDNGLYTVYRDPKNQHGLFDNEAYHFHDRSGNDTITVKDGARLEIVVDLSSSHSGTNTVVLEGATINQLSMGAFYSTSGGLIFKPGGGIDTLHDSGNENKILLLNASSNVSLTTDIAHEDLQISYTGGITTIEGQ